MLTVRLIGLILSAALHAAFALPFLMLQGSRALESGLGDDLLKIEQGIAIEARTMATDAVKQAEDVVKRNPIVVVAIALGLGLLIGVLTRR